MIFALFALNTPNERTYFKLPENQNLDNLNTNYVLSKWYSHCVLYTHCVRSHELKLYVSVGGTEHGVLVTSCDHTVVVSEGIGEGVHTE